MAICAGCSRRERDLPIPRTRGMDLIRGDIYAMKESVYTPIYDIFRQPSSNLGACTEAFARSQQSFLSITSTPDVIEDPRPAIIMETQNDDRRGTLVCLSTTFEKEDISKLPRVFRHFSIPIAPHDEIVAGHLCHLHSLPEWDRRNGWIIAWQFRSKATRTKLWTKRVHGEELPFVFGRDAMEFLRTECERRWNEWHVLCQDSKLAAGFEKEVKRHYNARKKRHHNTAGSNSVVTINSLSNVDKGRSPPTIPEESESKIVPGAGRTREPKPQKAARKVHAGSTYSLASKSGKAADTDRNSIKSSQSRSSVVGKSQSLGRFVNKFAVLRPVAPTAA